FDCSVHLRSFVKMIPKSSSFVAGHAPIVSVGDIAHVEKAGTVYVPAADQVGTVWSLLDGSAAVANSYEYDAFGVGRAASETFGNRYRFGTKRLDEDTELYHFIARQYMPELGRFASVDLLLRKLFGPARYRYSGNAPTRWVDSAGRIAWIPIIIGMLLLALLGAVIAIVGKFIAERITDFQLRYVTEQEFALRTDKCQRFGTFVASKYWAELDVDGLAEEFADGIMQRYPGVTVRTDGDVYARWEAFYCYCKLSVTVYTEITAEAEGPEGQKIRRTKRKVHKTLTWDSKAVEELRTKCCHD
ncbi:MAG: RHS repeat-associated core domain-containing protein, partial [Candidatus Brocadiia bacterium]